MSEEVELIKQEAKESMQRTIDHLDNELQKIRAGKANPSMLQDIRVEYYGALTPLEQVANVNAPDAKTLIIKPWEKSMLDPTASAILNSNLGLNPQNNGDMLIISLPPLTEERRKELVKRARAEVETAKVSIRGARKEANDEIKKLEKEGLAEDMAKAAEEEIQKLTDSYTKRADEKQELKEKDILTI